MILTVSQSELTTKKPSIVWQNRKLFPCGDCWHFTNLLWHDPASLTTVLSHVECTPSLFYQADIMISKGSFTVNLITFSCRSLCAWKQHRVQSVVKTRRRVILEVGGIHASTVGLESVPREAEWWEVITSLTKNRIPKLASNVRDSYESVKGTHFSHYWSVIPITVIFENDGNWVAWERNWSLVSQGSIIQS